MDTYVLPFSTPHLAHGAMRDDVHLADLTSPTPSTSNPARLSSSVSFRSSSNALQARLARCASTSLADLIPIATAALRREDDQTLNSTFARAVAKVKVQVQTRRLKEKYLSHEWIRLALGLPVDESKINCAVHAIPQSPHEDTSPKVYKSLDGRTGEIATWFEWRFNKAKFSIEEIESFVDRLRRRRQSCQ